MSLALAGDFVRVWHVGYTTGRCSRQPRTTCSCKQGVAGGRPVLATLCLVAASRRLNFKRRATAGIGDFTPAETVPLTRGRVVEVVEKYGSAWVTQDAEGIAALFAQDSVYVERAFDRASTFRGRDAIRQYWMTQIVGKQSDIKFRHIVGDMVLDADKRKATVKWLAEFDNIRYCVPQKEKRVRFVQVAILDFTDDAQHILQLEEYLQSTSNSRFRWPSLDASEDDIKAMLRMEPNALGTQPRCCQCKHCGAEFASRNSFFQHLRDAKGTCSTALVPLPPSELARESRRHVALTVCYHACTENIVDVVGQAAWKAFPPGAEECGGLRVKKRLTCAVPASRTQHAVVNLVGLRLPRCAEGIGDEKVAAMISEELSVMDLSIRILSCVSVGGDFHAMRCCEFQRYEALLPSDALRGSHAAGKLLHASEASVSAFDHVLALRLKSGIRQLRGTVSTWQNFCKACNTSKANWPCFTLNRAVTTPLGNGWWLISLAVGRAYPGMPQKLVGSLVAWARGDVEDDYLQRALSQEEMMVPEAPQQCLYLRGPHMHRFESKTGSCFTCGDSIEQSLQEMRHMIIAHEEATSHIRSWADSLTDTLSRATRI
eukprot:TRINITY_DN43002_c0_g1_i1.p1 TRINITY_DN43002_c0_g1~~TRINITY_DN43002_c0_g1_i1.p1  ORF type:complete len:601 (+),score=101.62 TRINITY_DN43002_c0_g1_i1:206-2008(+)